MNRRLWLAFGFSCLAHGIFLVPLFARTQNTEALASPRRIQATLAPSAVPEIESASSPFITSVAQKPFQQPVTNFSKSATKSAEKKLRDIDKSSSISSAPVASEKPQPAQLNQMPEVKRSGDRELLTQVDIEFEIYMGPERQFSGAGRQQYVSDGAGRYGLSISQVAPVMTSTADDLWRLEISGDIVPQGLSPTFFELKGALPERLMALKAGSESASPLNERSGRVRDGILDRQSLLYQFTVNPPSSSGGKITLTDGAKYSEYLYRLGESEMLRVGTLGEVRTIKLILTVSNSVEFVELWLIPELRYLPAKVRYSDERGFVTEQLVVSLGFK